MIDPTSIIKQYDSGAPGDATGEAGDMGDVTTVGAQDDNVGRVARFGLTDRRWCLKFVRAHFSGTGTATLSLKLDNSQGPAFDVTMRVWTGVGGGADLIFVIKPAELVDWIFEPGDELVFEWENPGAVTWGLEVGILDAENIHLLAA